MDCSLPDSSIHGIFQARVLEWGAIAFSDLSLGLQCLRLPSWCSWLRTCLPMQEMQEMWVRRRKWQPTPVFNPMDKGAWWGTVHGVTNRHDWSDWAHTSVFNSLKIHQNKSSTVDSFYKSMEYLWILTHCPGFLLVLFYRCVNWDLRGKATFL